MVNRDFLKFGDKKEIFLTANDEKKMLTETATNIKMETFDDSEVASPNTETQICEYFKGFADYVEDDDQRTKRQNVGLCFLERGQLSTG